MNIILKTTDSILFLDEVNSLQSNMKTIQFNYKHGQANIRIKIKDTENEYYEITEDALKNYADLIMVNPDDLYFTVRELLTTTFINTVYDKLKEDTTRLIIDLNDIFIMIDESLLSYGLSVEWGIESKERGKNAT